MDRVDLIEKILDNLLEELITGAIDTDEIKRIRNKLIYTETDQYEYVEYWTQE